MYYTVINRSHGKLFLKRCRPILVYQPGCNESDVLSMLKSLFQLYLQIMLLRKGPQDIPHSPFLLAAIITLVLVLSLLLMFLPDSKGHSHPVDQMVLFVLVHYAVMIGSVYLLLKALKYSTRTLQTLCALLGMDIIFSVLHLVLYLLSALVAPANTLVLIFSYILIIWSLVVNATIFRHALTISILAAGMLSYTFFLLSLYIHNQFGLLGG